MKGVELIAFDMDGLLLDSERVALEVFERTCENFSVPVMPELYTRCIGVNAIRAEQILRAGLEELVDYDAFQAFWLEHYEQKVMANEIPVKPGALRLLSQLSDQRVPMVVATSTTTSKARLKLSNAGLIGFFDHIIGGDQVSASKPAPDIYLLAANKNNKKANQCLAIEDSENGVLSALSAGMNVIQIPDLIEPNDQFKANGHRILESLDEVIELLQLETAGR